MLVHLLRILQNWRPFQGPSELGMKTMGVRIQITMGIEISIWDMKQLVKCSLLHGRETRL
jgi:hypothetical protein